MGTSTATSRMAIQCATSIESDPKGRQPHQRVSTHRLRIPRRPRESLSLGAPNEKPPPSAALCGGSTFLERVAAVDRRENQVVLGKRKRDFVLYLTPVLDEEEAVEEEAAEEEDYDDLEERSMTATAAAPAKAAEAAEEEDYDDVKERFLKSKLPEREKVVYDDLNIEVENVVERCIHLSEEIKSLARGIFEKIAPGFIESGGL